MARTQAPVIDTPLTNTSVAVGRGQPTIEGSVSTVQTAVRQQQIVDQAITRVQSVSVPQVVAIPQQTIVNRAVQQQVIQQSVAQQTVAQSAPVNNIINRTQTVIATGQDPAVRTATTTTNAPSTTRTRTLTQDSVASGNTTFINQRILNINNDPAPGGGTGSVQYLVNGGFGADGDFTYDSASDTLNINGRIQTSNLSVINNTRLGNVTNVSILGGQFGQILQTNGDGRLSWVTNYANANVAGYLPNYTGALQAGQARITQVNTSNITGNGVVNISVAGSGNVLSITNSGPQSNIFTSNNYTLGNSTTTISTTKWLDAITLTTNPTVLFTASNAVSSIDVHITADDGNSKQITKMLSVTKGTTTTYSQYGNVTIGNNMAAFTMDQSSGLVRVISQPTTANRVDYRLVVTLYN
jgi:hypothetical protein